MSFAAKLVIQPYECEESQAESTFLTDVKSLRERARRHIEQGAVTEGYQADRKVVLKLLDEALSTELVCVLRYPCWSRGNEIMQHANEEQAHADQIAARIVQLAGEPNLSPEGMLARSHSEYVEGEALTDMFREDLVASALPSIAIRR